MYLLSEIRKEDIGALTKYFLKNHSDSLDEELRVLSPEVMDVIANYDWPGNVRQLENTLLLACTYDSNSKCKNPRSPIGNKGP